MSRPASSSGVYGICLTPSMLFAVFTITVGMICTRPPMKTATTASAVKGSAFASSFSCHSLQPFCENSKFMLIIANVPNVATRQRALHAPGSAAHPEMKMSSSKV